MLRYYEPEPQSNFTLLIEPDVLLLIYRPDQALVASFRDMPEMKMLVAITEAWTFGYRAIHANPSAMYTLGRCVTRWAMVGISIRQIVMAISDPVLKEFFSELEREGGGFS